jgi:hypothetical protein
MKRALLHISLTRNRGPRGKCWKFQSLNCVKPIKISKNLDIEGVSYELNWGRPSKLQELFLLAKTKVYLA